MANEDKLIDYLSKEIETQTKNLMIFRERINFAVFIGPFVLLGAMLYGRGIIPRINWGDVTRTAWIALVVCFLFVILSYLTMGISCAFIERHMWEQCNIWRARIAEISGGHNKGFSLEQLRFQQYLMTGYLLVYFAMIIALACAITAVLILRSYIIPS